MIIPRAHYVSFVPSRKLPESGRCEVKKTEEEVYRALKLKQKSDRKTRVREVDNAF